jgi:hypothetical protein
VPLTNAQYNLRENRTRDYSHRFSEQQLLGFETNDALHNYVTGYVMTQMTAQAGIKKHGSKAIDALLAEFCQLDDKAVFNPMIATELTSEQKRAALRAVNLIKEKRCGKLKGLTCADGRPQQGLYDKQQTASPTVSTDALMISLMIDSFERRDVATADIEDGRFRVTQINGIHSRHHVSCEREIFRLRYTRIRKARYIFTANESSIWLCSVHIAVV